MPAVAGVDRLGTVDNFFCVATVDSYGPNLHISKVRSFKHNSLAVWRPGGSAVSSGRITRLSDLLWSPTSRWHDPDGRWRHHARVREFSSRRFGLKRDEGTIRRPNWPGANLCQLFGRTAERRHDPKTST